MISIYILINPSDNSVFYVGATKNPHVRMLAHINESKRFHTSKDNKIKEIIKAGNVPKMIIIDECGVHEVSFSENFYIQLFRDCGYTLYQNQKSFYSSMHDKRSSGVLDFGRWS